MYHRRLYHEILDSIHTTASLFYEAIIHIKRRNKMSLTTKRVIILTLVIIVAIILGRLAVRAFMNLLLGGTLLGGNFL